MTRLPRVEKVVAYIVRDGRVAVVVHDDDTGPISEAGLQVPAGTCKPGEQPQAAVLREAQEETGLVGLRVIRCLGDAEYDVRPYASEIHHRHFFHLTVAGPVEEKWLHIERNGSDDPPRPFRFVWLPIEKAHVLAAGLGAMLGSRYLSD